MATLRQERFNGWANYETWNISLWINNSEQLYDSAFDFMREYSRRVLWYDKKGLHTYSDQPYRLFIDMFDLADSKTPDGVLFNDSSLDLDELNEMLLELTD